MNNKTNTARKSYAEQGLEDVAVEMNTALAAVEATAVNTTSSDLTITGEEEWTQSGGLSKIDRYVRFTEPKKNAQGQYLDKFGKVKDDQTPQHQLQDDEVLTGVYEKSFTSGSYKKPTFLIREINGSLSAIGGAGSLEKEMAKYSPPVKVRIIYDGKTEIKDGKFKGNLAHAVRVFVAK